MDKDFLADRRKGFEEEFFRRQEAALLQRLRDEEARRSARQALAAASRITDEVLLDQLAALGIKPETLVVLSLVPLVEIAWADGTVQDSERRPIHEAARIGRQALLRLVAVLRAGQQHVEQDIRVDQRHRGPRVCVRYSSTVRPQGRRFARPRIRAAGEAIAFSWTSTSLSPSATNRSGFPA